MTNIDEIKKNLDKCSKCGLCQEICPIFEVKKTECALTRGKFLQLLGVLNKDLKFTKKILKNLDLCLNCDKCRLNCPSDINAVNIFSYMKSKKLSFWNKFFSCEIIFNLKMTVLKLFARKKNAKVTKVLHDKKIVYFEGCITKKLNNGLISPFKLEKRDFMCCGLPFLTKGRLDIYEKMKQHNMKIIEQDCDYVIFDCSTCLSAVKDYPFKDKKTKEKLILFTDLYKKFQLSANKYKKITFHNPCHLKSAGVELKEIETILKNIKNTDYVPLNDPDVCCGFGGDFFVRHPIIAKTLSFKKADDVISTGVDIVLTCCPTCLWSLKLALFLKGSKIKAMDLGEFINSLSQIPTHEQKKKLL